MSKNIKRTYGLKDNFTAFGEGASLFPTTEETLEPKIRKGKLKGATLVNLRTVPSMEGRVIGFVEKETEFIILEVADEWTKINYQDIHFGWMKSEYVEEVF